MTCCADDTTFLGYVCRSAYAPKLKAGQWVKVRAKVRFANVSVYRGEGPVLGSGTYRGGRTDRRTCLF